MGVLRSLASGERDARHCPISSMAFRQEYPTCNHRSISFQVKRSRMMIQIERHGLKWSLGLHCIWMWNRNFVVWKISSDNHRVSCKFFSQGTFLTELFSSCLGDTNTSKEKGECVVLSSLLKTWKRTLLLNYVSRVVLLLVQSALTFEATWYKSVLDLDLLIFSEHSSALWSAGI